MHRNMHACRDGIFIGYFVTLWFSNLPEILKTEIELFVGFHNVERIELFPYS